VVSRSSSFHFSKGENRSEKVAQELDVPFVLSGTISKEKGSFVVSTVLLDARNGENIWNKKFSKDTSELQIIQSEIAMEVATSLLKKTSPEIIYKVQKEPTDNVEAYYQVMIGKELLQSRLKNDLEESIKSFDKAILIDPSYSNAFAYKAMALHLLGNLGYSESEASNHHAEINALEALRLDNSNGYAYGVLGNVYANQYKWDQAESSFKIALESNPGDAILNYWFSLIKRTKNEISEAIFYNEKAKLLDPLYPVIHAGYIATCIYGKKYDKALERIQKDSVLFRNSFLYYWIQGEYYSATAEFEKALTYFEQGLALNPEIRSLKTSRAYVKAKLGDFEMAQSIISTLSSQVPSEIHTKAVLLSAIGQYEASLDHFISAAEKGFIASDVLVDPTYAPFVANPKYQTYLKKYNFIQ
jgi:tetratricopeptide (TPR) repeat protein